MTNDDNTITITGYTGSGGDVTIPDTINGLLVTSIGFGAFNYCTSLSSVTVPDSVTSIGIMRLELHQSEQRPIPNSVTSIGLGAFNFCTSLSSVMIPNSVTSIGDGRSIGASV